MYMSQTTKRLLAQQKPKAQQGTRAASPSALADSTDDLRGSVARMPPKNPQGAVVPPSQLPVRHKRLDGDPDATSTDVLAVIAEGSHLDSPMPLAAQARANHNALATKATKSDAQEKVVRSADSPSVFGPVAKRSMPPPAASPAHQPAAANASVSRRANPSPSPAMGAPPAPSPATLRKAAANTSVPPRPPSQQTSHRPGSASTAGGRAAQDATSDGDVLPDDASTAAAGPVNFATELEEIGRQLKAEQGNARSRHRAALAHAHQLRQTLGSTAPSPAPSGAAGPSPAPSMSADAFESTDATREEESEGEGRTATGKPLHVLYTPDIRAKLPPGTAAHSHVAAKAMTLRDYEMLAEACQRAGRARTEAHAYYKIGETLSAKKETRGKAINFFKRYLNLARRLNDLQGEAKALNCLGVVHYEMGGVDNITLALDFHQQHAAIADAAGVFIANTNMGLCHKKLGDAAAALQCFKNTLKYAVRAGDRAAESLALANLGTAGTEAGDFATARVCVERHLEISATMQDNASTCEAHEQLGSLAAQRGDFAAAVASFTQALEEALREGDQEKARALRCHIGVAQGMLKAEQVLSGQAAAMGSGGASM